MTQRTKGNAKHLFEADIRDGWLRKIPEHGEFGNRNIPSLGISGLHIGTDYGAAIGEYYQQLVIVIMVNKYSCTFLKLIRLDITPT